MKNLIIIIGTILLGALIVNSLILGDGNSLKTAAEDIMDEDEPEDTDNEDMDDDADAESMDLFEPAVTVCDYKKKSAAVEKLVTSAERDIVQAFLVSWQKIKNYCFVFGIW